MNIRLLFASILCLFLTTLYYISSHLNLYKYGIGLLSLIIGIYLLIRARIKYLQDQDDIQRKDKL